MNQSTELDPQPSYLEYLHLIAEKIGESNVQGLAQRLGTTGNSLYSFAKGKSVLHVRTLRAAVELISRVCPDEMDEFIHQTTAHFGWICAPLHKPSATRTSFHQTAVLPSTLPASVLVCLHGLQEKAELNQDVQRLLMDLNRTLDSVQEPKQKK